jgi:hypothetical protein
MADNYLVPDQTPDNLDAIAAQKQQQGFTQFDMLQAIKHWSKDNIGKQMEKSGIPNFNWAFADEELTLSNIDIKHDRHRISLNCSIIENDFLSSLPEEALTPQLILQLSNLRARITAVRAPRAHDGYERRLQATNIMSIERSMKVIKPAGVISRTLGRIAGKPKPQK